MTALAHLRAAPGPALVLLAASLAAFPAGAPAAPPEPPPRFAPLHPEPPYPYRNGWSIQLRFRTSPQMARALVPPPLEPAGDGAMLLIVGHHSALNLGAYNEAVLAVPCSLAGRQGAYALVTYVDSGVAQALGRERSGWNAKDARITLAEREGLVTALVERDGAVLMRASMRLSTPVPPGALARLTAPAWFAYKLIPSAVRGAPPEVAQLTFTAVHDRVVKAAMTGDGALELAGGPGDPLQAIPVLEVLGAEYTVADMELRGSEVVHDYLGRERASP